MRFVSYKMSLWLHRAIDESQMDLWLWLHCRATFAIACWTSSTRHLKLKTAINKLIIFLSKMCFFCLSPTLGSHRILKPLLKPAILRSLFFFPILFNHQLTNWASTSKKGFSCPIGSLSVLHPHQNLLKVSSHPVSNLWNTIKPLSTSTMAIHLQNPQMVPFGFLLLIFVCLFCLILFWVLFAY